MKKYTLLFMILLVFTMNTSVKQPVKNPMASPSKTNIPPATSSKPSAPVKTLGATTNMPTAVATKSQEDLLSSLTQDTKLDPKFIEKMVLDTRVSMKEILKEFELAEEEALKYYISTLQELIKNFNILNKSGALEGKLTNDINELIKFTNERIQLLNSKSKTAQEISNQVQKMSQQAKIVAQEADQKAKGKSAEYNKLYNKEIEKGKQEVAKINIAVKESVDQAKQTEVEVSKILKDINNDIATATKATASAQQANTNAIKQIDIENKKIEDKNKESKTALRKAKSKKG